MSDTIFIPFPRELYDDLVRFSDGRINPASLAAEKVEAWIDSNFSMASGGGNFWDDNFADRFGDRLHEFAEKYAPYVAEEWSQQADDEIARLQAARRPLVWKEVSVPAGSEVRMAYGGTHHYAKVQGGKILDGDSEYSPSEWAYKIANFTTRNAWRDLWFKEPGAPNFVPAQLLRDRAKEARAKAAHSTDL